jgi:hypothetical protein
LAREGVRTDLHEGKGPCLGIEHAQHRLTICARTRDLEGKLHRLLEE